ncbi:MAG: 50S ribosomal protein L13 [Sulfolobales archaeon]|nr:50S ribosomal protein L13 [Sulfolobales archaeon]MCX8199606.1 50S ribosomal protein L13 [Sulfolobales archaeon]
MVVDASNQVLGRLASVVAKKVLEGYRVHVINVEKAVISGERRRVIAGYKLLERVRTLRNPYRQGIRRPRRPDRIFKRTVRGMLPMDKPKGREALKRLKAYIGVPKDLTNVTPVRFPEADASRLKGSFITLSELAKSLGWRERVEHANTGS